MIDTNKLPTLCLVDDDDIQHFLFKLNMQSQGFPATILSFSDGQEAINFLSENLDNSSLLPDILFLDLNMPGLNGWQFLIRYAEIREVIKKHIRIYILSSSINPDEIETAKSIPEVMGFISKPLKPDDMRRILEAVA